MITQSETVSNMYVLYKDHKGWHLGLGTDPPSRPIASGNSGQNVHMSELTSEIVESVVTAYIGGVEIISTEDMLAKWDKLNEKNEGWTAGTWWDSYEEEGLVTCGKCLGEDDTMPDLCTCNDGEEEPDLDDHHDETIPEGWMDKEGASNRASQDEVNEGQSNRSPRRIPERDENWGQDEHPKLKP
jgi:hypothetical protein